MAHNGKEETHQYIQPSLVGAELDAEAAPVEETELENCLVLNRPVYKPATKKRPEHWIVRVHAQPTMFQPEMDTVFLATATNEQAVAVHKQGLKPVTGHASWAS